jgi:hypothetical protein
MPEAADDPGDRIPVHLDDVVLGHGGHQFGL